jgi:hypothetical protein
MSIQHAGWAVKGISACICALLLLQGIRMASFTQRSGKWRALVRRRNAQPISKTFRLKSDAERWA